MTGHKDTSGKTFIGLSVVIIARNEAKNIACTIEFVLRAGGALAANRDPAGRSGLCDETVLKRYYINIIRLLPSWFLSVAAGRHIGMHYTRGDPGFHVDGDMELDPEWVDRSMTYALIHPR